ncbi:hypothetical protein [Acetanaerobacterium elongatum]|uniref:Uncharacterized protein n=1 Tax=Acetanaerobacterium elongatum TaxID=258515 RepID=A0A1G9V265_9FIRM|nr:hypothetical protein [Acetanaerobacterium elongatum]SDM66096.1 hypothetical protein SAMN05192585_10326 [Acetanaerobacterium elongatum]
MSHITLNQLLAQDTELDHFFHSLPDYVQETIRERGNNIHSADALYRYAENLVQGDK